MKENSSEKGIGHIRNPYLCVKDGGAMPKVR